MSNYNLGTVRAANTAKVCIGLLLITAMICFGPASDNAAWADAAQFNQALAAIKNGDAATVDSLLSAGLDPNETDTHNNTMLAYAALLHEPQIVASLLKHGADVNIHVIGGETPLMCAAEVGDTNIVRALLDAGADVNASDNDNLTALSWAAMHEADDSMGLLIARGASIETHSAKTGWTPLMYASNYGNSGAVMMLIAEGALVGAQSKSGQTAEELAQTSDIKKLFTDTFLWTVGDSDDNSASTGCAHHFSEAIDYNSSFLTLTETTLYDDYGKSTPDLTGSSGSDQYLSSKMQYTVPLNSLSPPILKHDSGDNMWVVILTVRGNAKSIVRTTTGTMISISAPTTGQISSFNLPGASGLSDCGISYKSQSTGELAVKEIKSIIASAH